MTKSDIEKEFRKAHNYTELFTIATQLKKDGADETVVHRLMMERRNRMVKQLRGARQLEMTSVDNTYVPANEAMTYCSIVPNNPAGNRISFVDGQFIME